MLSFSSTKDIINLIDLEKASLMSDLDIQKSFNKQVLVFMKKLMANIDFSTPLDSTSQNLFYLNQATDVLNKTNININILNNLLENLTKLEKILLISDDMINTYNCNLKSAMTSIYENTEIIEKFIHDITINNFPVELPTTSPVLSIEASEVTETSTVPKKTLVISVTQGKVILPYDSKDIEDILQKNKRYHSFEEVVNKFYTKPISYYKFSSISRFKEAYKLIKEKEKGSTFKALSLAFELLGNYSLHPAIITACKSLDELDIYLACLDENTLNDFKFFDIKYEIPLAVSKASKKNI